ncbi:MULTISPECIES: hypothetical protein [Photorhabdus]|uniref:Uncharacterized protein n=2 Tax=Photorhabdus TaxID=29487 RepID=A0ABX0B352_9GAMM|nr:MULTISPECIES: hypothetical protein [Photorhabdus]MCC8373444.1 hypothetical protein [Photorhabdus bodei]MCC8456813.1 hypothetical protein [Photorhabdus aegyptia]MCT8353423.1 hypothetical protein [Photorhabdus kayaii]MDB6369680.1 hypothetical protein [Photorhabdus bodei]NDL13028.1 hypothetical protein [Photorhabdus kayaii]
MKTLSKLSFFSLICFSLLANKSWANNCSDCKSINGEFVKVKEVGIVVGQYNYILTKDGKKVEIHDNAVQKAQIAFVLDLPFYIDDRITNYSIKKD